MKPRAAVFSHNGLGDGINLLVLSHNLYLNGWSVTTYQNTIGGLQSWFPHLPIVSYPKADQVERVLESYDWFFVVQNDTDPFVIKLIQEGKKRFPERLKVIYLYPSKNIVNDRYYADCLTDIRHSVAENMALFVSKILHLPISVLSNGIQIPENLHFRKNLKTIAIHPTSSRSHHNWPKEKFLSLALALQRKGLEPVFIPGYEKQGWENIDFPIAEFRSLDLLARFLYEVGYFIGNDSGPGHLASALGIPTLTFCRRKALGFLWRPSFSRGVVITPPSWVPNIRGLRWRDRHWQRFISVAKAKRAFKRLFAAQSDPHLSPK